VAHCRVNLTRRSTVHFASSIFATSA